MSSKNQKVWPNNLMSIDSATFTGSYQIIGVALPTPVRLIRVYNDANIAVTISWDGINDMDYLPSKGFFLYDFSSNSEDDGSLEIPALTAIYVKGAAGTGSVYLTSFFAR